MKLALGRWILPLTCLLIAGYFLGWPMIRPRGAYVHGHFRVIDLYVGVPALAAAMLSTSVSMAPPAHRRRLGIRLGIAFVTGFGALFAVDAAVALLSPRDYRMEVMGSSGQDDLPDPVLGWRRKPFISTAVQRTRYGADGDEALRFRVEGDSRGFRNPPKAPPPVGKVIGDSFTEAPQVPLEETFVSRVGMQLGAAVENLGASGYGPPQELDVLRAYGLSPTVPKWIVWQLYEGSDLADTVRFLRWRKNPAVQAMSPILQYTAYSPLLSWLGNPPKANSGVSRRLPQGGFRETSRLAPYLPDVRNEIPGALAGVESALRDGRGRCAAAGVRLLVLFVPVEIRVQPDVYQFSMPEVRSQYLPGGLKDSPHDFESRITQFCRTARIDFRSLTPALRKRRSAGEWRLYVPFDGHFDRGGHEVAADAILDWVTQRQP